MGEGERTGKGREHTWHLGSILFLQRWAREKKKKSNTFSTTK